MKWQLRDIRLFIYYTLNHKLNAHTFVAYSLTMDDLYSFILLKLYKTKKIFDMEINHKSRNYLYTVCKNEVIYQINHKQFIRKDYRQKGDPISIIFDDGSILNNIADTEIKSDNENICKAIKSSVGDKEYKILIKHTLDKRYHRKAVKNIIAKIDKNQLRKDVYE